MPGIDPPADPANSQVPRKKRQGQSRGSNQVRAGDSWVGLVQQKFAKEPQATFPVLLLKMLDHYTSNSSDLMGWCEDGKSFFLARGDARIAEAIKPWFAHGNYASLRRQLSAYRFFRELDPVSGVSRWRNKLFRCDCTATDLQEIQRSRTKRKKRGGKMSDTKVDLQPIYSEFSVAANTPLPGMPTQNETTEKVTPKQQVIPATVELETSGEQVMSPLTCKRSSAWNRIAEEDVVQSTAPPSPTVKKWVPDIASPGFVSKESESSTFFSPAQKFPLAHLKEVHCSSCRFYDGTICCERCPSSFHENCKSSQCIAAVNSK